MVKLPKDEVLKLARLARLHISDDEIDQFTDEIGIILGYVEQLNDVDLSNLEPTAQVTGLQSVMRADEEVEYIAKPKDLLKNAPATEDGHIKVKRMLA